MFLQWQAGLWTPDWQALPHDLAGYLAAMAAEYRGAVR